MVAAYPKARGEKACALGFTNSPWTGIRCAVLAGYGALDMALVFYIGNAYSAHVWSCWVGAPRVNGLARRRAASYSICWDRRGGARQHRLRHIPPDFRVCGGGERNNIVAGRRHCRGGGQNRRIDLRAIPRPPPS
jgi:hypothetical protein